MPDLLQQKLSALPARPGCYLFKGASGAILYVGKAVSLRSRVRSYFRVGARHTPRTSRLVAHITDFEVIVTSSELEALVLECTLIKRHQPRYNIRLRDD
ncbi:MAG: GIY-YIG nuclease family protein, partial [Armatimonadetes bacterium]|nr:GIY-YIG nuclease family protein [Armatimonadota bacterium]